MFSTACARLRQAAALSAFLGLATGAQAGGWNEGVQGDLPGNGLTPQVVTVTPGSNTFVGTSGRDASSGVIDRDYFTVTIPAGYELSSMLVLDGTLSVGSGSFIGLMNGSSFTVSPTGGSAAGMLGWAIFGEGNIGGDLLLYMSAPGAGSSGYTPPLQAGTYAFWVQENGTGVATYAFGMDITPVPEPATALSLLAGLVVLAGVFKRR